MEAILDVWSCPTKPVLWVQTERRRERGGNYCITHLSPRMSSLNASRSSSQPVLDTVASLTVASEQLAAEVADLSAALGARASWSARVTADHTTIAARSSNETLAAVARAEDACAKFLVAANALRSEIDTLRELEAGVKRVLVATAALETRVDRVLAAKAVR